MTYVVDYTRIGWAQGARVLLFLHHYLAGGHELIYYVHDMIEYGVDHSIRHRWAHGGRACLCPRAISDPAPALGGWRPACPHCSRESSGRAHGVPLGRELSR